MMRLWLGALVLPLVLLLGLAAGPAFAGPAHLVADLDTGVAEPSNYPVFGPAFFYSYTPVNGRIVFLTFLRDSTLYPQDFQCGLWVTDGTAGGTERLAELCAGDEYDSERRNLILATTGELAFFTDSSGLLWRTDGTAAGTFGLGEVRVPDTTQNPEPMNPAVASGRTLFFIGCTVDQGCEPWASDGTRRGTRSLRNIGPHRLSSDPTQLTPLPGGGPEGGILFRTQRSLWTSDGTPDGTVELFRTQGDEIGRFVVVGPSIYLTAFTNPGSEVWKIDPAAHKLRRVQRFEGDYGVALYVEEVGGRILITHASGSVIPEPPLWETDGTRAGTYPIGPPFLLSLTYGGNYASAGRRIVFPASRVSQTNSPPVDLWVLEPGLKRPFQLQGCPGGCPKVSPFVSFGSFEDRLFFSGWDEEHGYELWETDGTGPGTRRVKDLCPGPCDGDPRSFRVVLGRLLLEAFGSGLWASDGTPQGTVLLAPVPDFTMPLDVAVLDGRVLFTGIDPARGSQPMATDLSPEGTKLLLPLGNGIAAGSQISNPTRLGARVVFTACSGRDSGVWVSDGTAAGTLELPVGEEDFCTSTGFVRAGDFVFFSWDKKLWRTDGTPAGTVELLDLSPALYAYVTNMAALGGKLLFMPFQSETGERPPRFLWETDGTPQGTRRVLQEPFPGGASFGLTTVGNEAYFDVREPEAPSSQALLYRTDGTAAGTRSFLRGRLTGVEEMVGLGGNVYFIARSLNRPDVNAGPLREIWRTDGTAAGTSPLFRDRAAPHPDGPMNLTVFKGALYFFSSNAAPGAPRGLWRTDGTAAGTRLVSSAVLPPFGLNGNLDNSFFLFPLLTPVGDTLFFRADDGIHGTELWKTDGTAAGTVLVRDIAPGAATARLSELTAAGGKLYFAATDAEHGLELWQSDGTAAGTRMTDDIQPGTNSSAPSQLTAADGQLFFTANDGQHGRELWVLPLPR
jgi:ELWxxDGT repeat protein